MKPVAHDEFLCRCGGDGAERDNIERCDEVVTETKRRLTERDWQFDPGDPLDLQRTLLYALTEMASIEIVGDQWFAVSADRWVKRGDAYEKESVARIQCDDPFDGICGCFLVLDDARETPA